MIEPLHVLLIEDSESDAMLVLRALRLGGYTLQHARIQTEAELRTALLDQQWNVIIADYQLPSFNAPTALAILKQSGNDIPFIVASGTIGERVAVEMMRAGASDYVMKDNLERLPEAVRRELREALVRAEHKLADAALHSLIEATASFTGQDFFQALVKQIAIALRVKYVLVNELSGAQLRSLAFWGNGTLQPNITYATEQSPCELALVNGFYVHHGKINQQFPIVRQLVEDDTQCYLGVALRDARGQPFGTLCILDPQPLRMSEQTQAILHVFAIRAAAELERQQALQTLQQVNEELESIVEQRTAQLRKSNEQLGAINMELARATRLKDEFLANMSHELRTPLNAILGLSESLQEAIYGELTERQHKAITTIENSGRYLLKLIGDILDLSKIASGKLELNHSPIEIGMLFENSILFVREQALRKQIRLTSSITLDLYDAQIMVDELRIRQALINLLANAVKFTPEGGTVRLEARLERQEDPAPPPQLLLQVIDTGIGIADHDLNLIFEPFVQVDSELNRQNTGTGLGLALVKQITELHGGSVRVESIQNKGSCFTIALPFITDLVMFKRPSEHSLEASATKPTLDGLQSPLILIAEDNELNIDMFWDYLHAQGYRLIIARNGIEALEIALAERPDLILMDIQMPGMDGLECTRQLRMDAQMARVPIIALTALAMPGDRDRVLAAGANLCLAKPIRLKQLAETIRQQLQATL